MPRPKHEQPGYAILKRLLEEGHELDVKRATVVLMQHREPCRKYLGLLHQHGVVYIARWRQTNQRGRWFPVYKHKLGGEQDAPKPGIEERHARRRLKRCVRSKGMLPLLLGEGK